MLCQLPLQASVVSQALWLSVGAGCRMSCACRVCERAYFRYITIARKPVSSEEAVHMALSTAHMLYKTALVGEPRSLWARCGALLMFNWTEVVTSLGEEGRRTTHVAFHGVLSAGRKRFGERASLRHCT